MTSIALSVSSEKKLVWLLAAIQFCYILDFMVMMPLGPQLMRVLDITAAEFGWLVSAYTLSAGIAGFVSVFLVDRFDRRHTLLWLFGGFLLATLACGFAWNFSSLVLARVLAGMFGGVLLPAILAIVADSIPVERRGTETGRVMMGMSLATVVGVPLCIYLANQFGWRMPFLFIAVVSLPILLLAPRSLPSVPARETGPLQIPETLRAVTGDRNHRYAFALMSALMLAGFSVIAFISPHLVQNVGLSEKQLPLIYLCGGIGSLLTSPLIGWFSDRVGKARVFRLLCLWSLPALLAMTQLPVVPVAVVMMVMMAFMVLVGGRLVAVFALLSTVSHPGMRGRFLSFNAAVQQLMSGIAAFLPTLVLTQDAQGRLLHFDWVGYAAMAMTLLAFWLAGRIEVRS